MRVASFSCVLPCKAFWCEPGWLTERLSFVGQLLSKDVACLASSIDSGLCSAIDFQPSYPPTTPELACNYPRARKIPINVRGRLDPAVLNASADKRTNFRSGYLPSTQTGQRGKRYRIPASKSCYCVPRIWDFAPRRFAGLTSARSLRNQIYGISFFGETE